MAREYDYEQMILEARAVQEKIRPLLAGKGPEIQGAVLSDLVAIFIASHYQHGDGMMKKMLSMHIDLVRKLVPENVKILKARGEA